MSDEKLEWALRWRDVEDPCLACLGSGVRMYSNTSTWMGGMGGAMMTKGVCDSCWGSGDRYRQWADLRRLRNEEHERVAKRALSLLADSVGASLKVTTGSIVQIIEVLEKFANKRGTDFTTASLADGLANTLRRAIGVKEKKIQ